MKNVLPIKCSKCKKKALGLKTEGLKFDPTDEVRATHFTKLYESKYELKPGVLIECPECKNPKYINDIMKTWAKEVKLRKGTNGQRKGN